MTTTIRIRREPTEHGGCYFVSWRGFTRAIVFYGSRRPAAIERGPGFLLVMACGLGLVLCPFRARA